MWFTWPCSSTLDQQKNTSLSQMICIRQIELVRVHRTLARVHWPKWRIAVLHPVTQFSAAQSAGSGLHFRGRARVFPKTLARAEHVARPLLGFDGLRTRPNEL